MVNTIIAPNILEAKNFSDMSPEEERSAIQRKVNKRTNRLQGKPAKEIDTFKKPDIIGSRESVQSKIESAYKTYFRKLIDGQLKSFGKAISKRTNITQIGPSKDTSANNLIALWKSRNPNSENIPAVDHIRLELIYEEANDILEKYAKEAFGESKDYHLSQAGVNKEIGLLRQKAEPLEKQLDKVNKELDDVGEAILRPNSYSENTPNNKNKVEKDRISLETLKGQIESELENITDRISRIYARQTADSSPTSVQKIDENKLKDYVYAVLNVSANQEVEGGAVGIEARNTWPNISKRPPIPSQKEMGTVLRYEKALSMFAKEPTGANEAEVKSLFVEIEENAAPIFADYFGIYELHLEGMVDPQTGIPQFPYAQLLNVLISKLIESIDILVRKSRLVQRELKNPGKAKPENIHTDITGNKQIISRAISSNSEEETAVFHRLFIDNKYGALGAGFSAAEEAMASALQKNINAINTFLGINKNEVISLINSLGNKITQHASNSPNPLNDYNKEFKLYGLDFLIEDAVNPSDPKSIENKNEELQARVRREAFDYISKWLIRFKKIPPEAKPFSEIQKFLKLVDTKFTNEKNKNNEAFEVTYSGISKEFFNPALFFLTLVDNKDILNSGKELKGEDYINSDWGNGFRAYMGAQKLKYTSPRDDLATLVDINRFMREGFTPQGVAEDQLSDLGTRLKTASETQPKNVVNKNELSLLSGDKNELINSRDFLDKLKKAAPNDYSFSLFQKYLELKTLIQNKKINKEYEEAKAIYDGPFLRAEENIITILSPILREFLFTKYSQETRLTETLHLFYAALREFKSLIRKYDPETDGNVEDWLIVNLEKFNKTKIVRAMNGGSDRLWSIPQGNDQIKAIMLSILGIADIREHHRSEQFNAVRRLAPTSQRVDRNTSLINYSYADDLKKDNNGKTAYDREKERAIPTVDARTGKKVFEVIDKSEKDIVSYSIEPRASLIRDPETAARVVAKIWHVLEVTFWKNLDKIGFPLKGLNISNPNNEYPENTLDQYYFDQLHRKLAGYSVLGNEGPKKATVVEPIASDASDNPNQYKKTITKGKEETDIDNKIMELLSIASLLFDAANIDERTFNSKINSNLYSTLGKFYGSKFIEEKIRAVVHALFAKDWAEITDILFRQIGNKKTKTGEEIDNPDYDTRGLKVSSSGNKNTEKVREAMKEPLILVLGTILATSAHIIKENSEIFMELQKNELNKTDIFSKLGVEKLYHGYARLLDSLKELLNAAFLKRLAKSEPKRGFPKGRGVTETGRKSVFPYNLHGSTAIAHPYSNFTLGRKWARMASGLGYEFAQNQDPTSDARQQAMLAMQNAQNRFLYKLQQYYKKQNGEEVGPNEGNPVKLDNIYETLGNSIEGEVGGAFRDMYTSRRFAGSSFKNGEMDKYHGKIVKKLRKEIEGLGYRVDRAEWFNENQELRQKAIRIVEENIKAKYLRGVESGGSLAGPGNIDKGKGKYRGTRDRDINPDKYIGKPDLGVFRGNGRGVSGPSNPLYRKGNNPDARLLGDKGIEEPSIYAPDYSSAMENNPIDPGFLGNTNINLLSDEDKKINADRRLAQFIELYPQFLEEKGMLNISMFEPRTVDSKAATLEDTLGEEATAEGQASLTAAVRQFDYILDNECFSKIKSNRKKVFKTQEDATNNINGIDMFVDSYKNLDEQNTKLVNSLIDNLEFSVIDSIFNSRDKFLAAISGYKDKTSERVRTIKEILFIKYFEYIYIREVLLAETILYLIQEEEANRTPEEIKANELNPSSVEDTFENKIRKYIDDSGIYVKHVPGIEYQFFKNASIDSKISLDDMLTKIFGVSTGLSEYNDISRELINYIGSNSDSGKGTEGTEDPKTYGQSAKSSASTDIHGMEASKSSKIEDSRVSALDKKLFGSALNINNVAKDMRDLFSGKNRADFEDYSFKQGVSSKEDEIRSIIRNLIGVYNTPITPTSSRENIDWFYSNIKTSANKIRSYLYIYGKVENRAKELATKINNIKNNINSIMTARSSNRENIMQFKKLVEKFIYDLYNLPIGEEEDFSSLDTESLKQKLVKILNMLLLAEKLPETNWNSYNIKIASGAIKEFGRLVKEDRVEIVANKKDKERKRHFLISKGGLLDSTIAKLNSKLIRNLLPPEIAFEISNYITQITEYISDILKNMPDTPVRELRPFRSKKDPSDPNYDPFEDDSSAYADKDIINDLERQASSKYKGPSYGSGTKDDPYRTTPELPKKLNITKESREFEPFKQAITIQKIMKCIKTQAAGMQKLIYSEYGRQFPAKLSRVLFELAKQEPFDVDNYRVFITEENKSKVNIVFEYKDKNRSCPPEYLWVIPKRTTSSN